MKLRQQRRNNINNNKSLIDDDDYDVVVGVRTDLSVLIN